MNKPASRVRSIALLAVVILGYPFYMLFNHLFFYGKVEFPSFIDTTVIFIALCLISYVLLGNNCSRMLTAVFFIFSIINLAQFPVVYFTAVFIHPVNDFSYFLEEYLEFPQLYFGSIFTINIIITICCLLAARWLRNTKLKPPPNIYIPFIFIFIIFTFIVLFWLEDFSLMSMSFLSSFFMGSILIVILIFLFYLYTRLTADNSSSAVKNTETQISIGENDKYTPFIQLLSRRELEVIESILAGNVRYKEISKALNISVHTVKKHLRRIYQITGTPNTAAVSNLFNGYSSSYPKSTP